jgi:tRNA(Leu) C34 or U34 (ribose-2'-O)-methylase TrmL
MKGYRDVTWVNHDRPFDIFGEHNHSQPICIEIHPGSMPLIDFVHPTDAVYVFGPEDGGVPQVIRGFCHAFVHIPAFHCLNLAAALNVVLYDRATKLFPTTLISVAAHEQRGEIPVPGWEGQ